MTCNISTPLLLSLEIIQIAVVLAALFQIVLDEHLVKKALSNKKQQICNACTYKYVNKLMNSVSMNNLHDPENFSCDRCAVQIKIEKE